MEEGFYWVYDKQDNEWTICELSDGHWLFLGGDETVKELNPEYYEVSDGIDKKPRNIN